MALPSQRARHNREGDVKVTLAGTVKVMAIFLAGVGCTICGLMMVLLGL